jgi:hypothetical protein
MHNLRRAGGPVQAETRQPRHEYRDCPGRENGLETAGE